MSRPAVYLLLAGLMVGILAFFHCQARADYGAVRLYAFALASVAANEAGVQARTDDVALINQAAESHAQSPRGRLQWLRSHSRRVLGRRTCLPRRNCQWSRHLRWNDRKPLGWPAGVRWRAAAWEQLRRRAWGLATGRETLRPCDGVIVSWGSRQDMLTAHTRGLEAAACKGTRNIGAKRAG